MLFSRYQGFLTSLPVRKKYEHSDLLVSDLLLAEEGRLRVFYAPLDWANANARVIILGITPGWTQMRREITYRLTDVASISAIKVTH